MTNENDARRAGTVRAPYAAYIDGRKDIVAAMLTEDSPSPARATTISTATPISTGAGRHRRPSNTWRSSISAFADDEAVVRAIARSSVRAERSADETLRFRGDGACRRRGLFCREA